MLIKKAEFVMSNTDYLKCPKPDKPEYALIGRSNVGKSSLINRLTNHLSLAKTSQVPGKTQVINHFLINEKWYLVDLPGYGWAKVSKTEKEKWDIMIKEYLLNRPNLVCVMVLIDSRLEPQPIDLEFMAALAENQIPFVMIFTKADKNTKGKTLANVAHYQEVMLQTWEEMPKYFLTSAQTGEGCEEVKNYIAQLNAETNFA